MGMTDLLDRPIAYHRVFVTLTGSVRGAILLSQAVYWQKRARQTDGWWYKTKAEWEDETGLSRRELDTARKECELFLKTERRDVPARLYWKLDDKAIEKAIVQLGGKRLTGEAENADLVRAKTPNIKRNAETTTENTTSDGKIFQFYASDFGNLTERMADTIKDTEQDYPQAWILEAMQIAVEANKQSWGYVKGILKRSRETGKSPKDNARSFQSNIKDNGKKPEINEKAIQQTKDMLAKKDNTLGKNTDELKEIARAALAKARESRQRK